MLKADNGGGARFTVSIPDYSKFAAALANRGTIINGERIISRATIDLMRENLEEESREFWDGLFNFYDWNEIYTSALFSNDPIANSYTIHENKYLKDNEFKKLKTLIDKVNIKIYNSDLKDLSQLVMKKYDLVYLSNICNYMNLLEYKKIMESLPLKENGEILTYFYKKQDHVLKYFDDENYTFDQFEKASSGVLVYKKIK